MRHTLKASRDLRNFVDLLLWTKDLKATGVVERPE